MKKIALGALLSLSTALSTMAQGAGEIVISSGGKTGNYYQIANDIVSYCASPLKKQAVLSSTTSNGSVDNLMGMANKKYQAGIVQEDVLYFYADTMPNKVSANRMKLISELHQETIHLLIPRDFRSKTQNSGWLSLFSSTNDHSAPVVSLSKLKGQTIGAWGGALVSVNALNLFLDLGMKIEEIPEDKRLSPNMPVLLVGGQPYKPVQDLIDTGKYRLIAIDYNELGSNPRTSFYSQVNASYAIGGGTVSVPTIGVRALLLGNSYRKPERNVVMHKLSSCIHNSLLDLSDDPNTSPAWGSAMDLLEADQTSAWEAFPYAS